MQVHQETSLTVKILGETELSLKHLRKALKSGHQSQPQHGLVKAKCVCLVFYDPDSTILLNPIHQLFNGLQWTSRHIFLHFFI
jgi:hypothetical protein